MPRLLNSDIKTKKRLSGAALITVLLVVTIVTVSATALLRSQDRQIRRTTGIIHGGQGLQYLRAIEDWAKIVLERDAQKGNVDSQNEDWALQLSPVSVEGGAIFGRLFDAQGRFNLNNLFVDGKYQPVEHNRFVRLLIILDVPVQQAIIIADSLRDWLDPDQIQATPSGSEDQYYLGLARPYRSAGMPMVSASEIRLVKGMDDQIWRKLQPYVIALPGYRHINVNTASAKVLQSISPAITEYTVKDILEKRNETPFNSIRTFIDFVVNTDQNIRVETQGLGVNSNFYLLSSNVHISDNATSMTSLLHRNSGLTNIVHRSFGSIL